MGDDVFEYQGWEPIESMIRSLGNHCGYVNLIERCPDGDGRISEQQIDAFDFEDEDEIRAVLGALRQRERDASPADPWDEPLPQEAGEDDDDDDESEADIEPPEDEEPAKPTAEQVRRELMRDALVVRCLAKLKDSAQDNITGERAKTYVVKVMAPKAAKVLGRKQFTLRNLGPVNEDNPRIPAVVVHSPAVVGGKDASKDGMPVYDLPIGLSSVRAFQALAHHYERYGTMVHGHVERTLGLEAKTNQRLHTQLEDAYKQIDNLTGHIITLRSLSSEEDKAALKTLNGAERAKLANSAIDKVSDVAKAFFQSRGLTEHAIKIVNLLGQHPKIKLLLDRQDVVAVLSDPNELDAFAGGLYDIMDMSAKAYTQRKAAENAAATNNDKGAP